MAYREAPEGWYQFGTHVDVPVRLQFSKETDEAGMPLWERPVAVFAVPCSDLKMLRETLCVAQAALGQMTYTWPERSKKYISPVIEQIDTHRPLGPDGKHGDRHTPTCGCEDR